MNKKYTYVLLGVTSLVVVGTAGFLISEQIKGKETSQRQVEQYEKDTVITHQGKTYEYNSSLRTILFMGIDKSEEMSEKTVGNGGQSDSLILVILDSEKKNYRLLTISRDAMVDIQTYDVHGEKLGTERAQLALQYAYGDGEKRSCRLTKEAVSKLLYEIPIHSYVSLTIEGFSVLTDELGGVELTIPEDYTSLDPQFAAGKTMVMDGKTAERYVRMRDKSVVGGNSQRMKRQEQFLTAMVETLQKKLHENPDSFSSIMKVMEPYMETDLTVDHGKKLAEFEQVGEITSVPGEVQRGDEHDEFIVDNEKLKELVLELFYKSKE